MLTFQLITKSIKIMKGKVETKKKGRRSTVVEEKDRRAGETIFEVKDHTLIDIQINMRGKPAEIFYQTVEVGIKEVNEAEANIEVEVGIEHKT